MMEARARSGQTDNPKPAERAAEHAPKERWCRLGITLALVPPTPGRLISIDRGPASVRLILCTPRPVMYVLLAVLLGQQPWAAQLLAWIRAHLGA